MSERPRPKLRTANSTNWSWPRLVNVQEQKAKIEAKPQPKKHSSAAPSLHEQKRVMSFVVEEKSAPASPIVSPGAFVHTPAIEKEDSHSNGPTPEHSEAVEEPSHESEASKASGHEPEADGDEYDGHMADDESDDEDEEEAEHPVVKDASPSGPAGTPLSSGGQFHKLMQAAAMQDPKGTTR